MRNFKKFLALVLAMLMVSACAVSVSAFDDVAAGDKYAEAIELLADLGVITGRGDGKFYPNDTLTRAEAAVIAAKTLAGATPIEWAAETTKFEDVTDKWSFAYINYAADAKVMIGTGNGFDPKRELQIDEAIKIALAIADPEALRDADIETAKNPTGYWADHYIAEAKDLLVNLGTIRNYEAKCSRGMFAQIIANAINEVDDLKASFGYNNENATVEVADKVVTVTSIKNANLKIQATEELFNATLAGFGITETAATLDATDSIINVVWLDLGANTKILSVEVISVVDTVIYSDNKIELCKLADGKTHDLASIKIDGIKYTIGADDADGKSTILGAAANPVYGIAVEIDGNKIAKYVPAADVDNPETEDIDESVAHGGIGDKAIPTYYKATLYDYDGDGEYDFASINTYDIAVLTATEVTVGDKKVPAVKVDYVGAKTDEVVNEGVVSKTYADAKAPVLVDVIGKNIDVIEVAEVVTGKVTNLKDGSYLTFEGVSANVEFAADFVVVPKWVLGQNISVYTIGDKYVSIKDAETDTGVVSGMLTAEVLVEKVTIVDGVALVEGYELTSEGKFVPFSQKVIGAEIGGKLVAQYAFNEKATENYNADKDAAGASVVDEKDDAFALVYLSGKDAEGKPTNVPTEDDDKFLIKNLAFYNFKITSAGVYFAGASDRIFIGNMNIVAGEVKIDGSYIKENGTAQYKLASDYEVVTFTTVDTTKAYNAYSVDLKFTAKGTIPASTMVAYGLRNAKFEVVNAGQATNEVSMIILYQVVEKAPTYAPKYQKTLAEAGVNTIVQIVSEENVALDYTTYKALDLFTGAEVTVTTKTGTYNKGQFVDVNAAGEIMAVTKWLGEFTVAVEEVLGEVTSITSYNNYLKSVCVDTEKGTYGPYEFYNGKNTAEDKDKVTIDASKVVIYKLENGLIKVDDAAKLAAGTYYGFINDGKVVILPN